MDFLVFEEKAISRHGHLYDYSEVRLTNNKEKVEIICGKHGAFFQAPDHHIRGRGCPSCAIENRKRIEVNTREEFIAEAEKVHEGFYDYNSVLFTGLNEKVVVECPVHGKFSTLARKHLREKRGCPSCGRIRNDLSKSASFQEFFDKAVDRHGLAYSYINTSLTNMSDRITVGCNVHGNFEVVAASHVRGVGCPGCRPRGSAPENELADFVESLGFTVRRNCRDIIKPLELDIVVDSLKIAIEFNGVFWHSEEAGKKHWYHQKKTLAARKAGYRLFHVYDSEWDLSQDVVKSKIMNILRPEEPLDMTSCIIMECPVTGVLELYNPETDAVMCYMSVDRDTVMEYHSPLGVEPLKLLMELADVPYLKIKLDWPDLCPAELVSKGFRKAYQVPPEKVYFHKRSKLRVHTSGPVPGNTYSVSDSGSIVWRLQSVTD